MPFELLPWQQRVMDELKAHKGRILCAWRMPGKSLTQLPLTGTTATHVILDEPHAN